MNSRSDRIVRSEGLTTLIYGLFFTVLGSRLAVFSFAGSPLPYYDQWFAEFNNTLIAIVADKGVEALLINHNEHLLLTTKILTLVGYSINGYWDIPFLALCSAGIRALTAAWTFQLIAGCSSPKTRVLLWLLCAAIFAVPYSAFNSLNGMQVSFYLVDFALLWSLRATTGWTTPVMSGLALIGGTLFGLVSFASAVAIPACTLAAHLLHRRSRVGFWSAWTISAMIATVFVISRRHILESISASQAPISLQTMVHSWFRISAWPILLAPIGVILVLLSVIALVIASKRANCWSAPYATALGLGVYGVVNAAFIAVSRGPSDLHMRHFETIAFIPLAVLACGILLADQNIFKRPVMLITGMLTLCYVFSVGNLIRTVSGPYLERAHDTRTTALDHYRMVIMKEDLNEQSARYYAEVRTSGYTFFDDPIGRFNVPPVALNNIVALNYRPLSFLSPEITSSGKSSICSRITNKLIDYGWLFGLLGLGLAVAVGQREFCRSADPTRP